jgi:hypothetical protein
MNRTTKGAYTSLLFTVYWSKAYRYIKIKFVQ